MKGPGGLRRGNWSVAELERLRLLLPRRGIEATASLLHRSPASVQRKAAEMFRSRPRRGPFSAADEALLRDAWGALDVSLLAAALGRPEHEVRRHAEHLRAQVKTGAWSRADVLLLKDLYGTRTDLDLEVSLSRPAAAIAAMARRFCLAKDKRFTAHEARPAGADTPVDAAATAAPDLAVDDVPANEKRMPRWTAEQVARLREIYGDHDNLAVARALGRSVNSVANKANQLGLKKSARLLTDLGRSNVRLRYDRSDEGIAEA